MSVIRYIVSIFRHFADSDNCIIDSSDASKMLDVAQKVCDTITNSVAMKPVRIKLSKNSNYKAYVVLFDNEAIFLSASALTTMQTMDLGFMIAHEIGHLRSRKILITELVCTVIMYSVIVQLVTSTPLKLAVLIIFLIIPFVIMAREEARADIFACEVTCDTTKNEYWNAWRDRSPSNVVRRLAVLFFDNHYRKCKESTSNENAAT